ncbi:4Fe-4S dicluster domain-containing protein [Emcibacteraceae bacterium]|uniref:4Fe-4S dicluster domain-containing protein n=1 Tax=Pseudemcibacter sp. TaxID=2943293 RepID=UPI0023152BEC|nr:4Fe-4S dicluster domain-containing protein [Emcibacteraceae bacterium]MDA9770171.1 4Fe-4S dicluster domain-containing protein [Emcibacteraceae bacterium]MDC1090862.1 4Fe-4S dicluster domain-containing protein [Emcibacteraceae bacterium]
MRKKEKFIPSEEQMALWPDVSGNDLNGLGETKVRRPSPIYWQTPDLTPFGPLMQFFVDHAPRDEDLYKTQMETDRIRETIVEPISDEKVEKTSTEWTKLIKEVGVKSGAVAIGITKMRPEWVIDTFEVPYETVITIGVAMDFENLKTAPEVPSAIEVIKKYGEAHLVSHAIANYIHEQGWNAISYGGSNNVPILLIPPAIESGLGELGKHGSLINRENGSVMRLGALVTDMPLNYDSLDVFGVDDFCLNCKACEKACPPEAIQSDKKMVRGVEKWYVDFDKCLPYFNENTGCGICLAVCPWSHPGVPQNLVKKIAKKKALK